jgi:hypothetical protein
MSDNATPPDFSWPEPGVSAYIRAVSEMRRLHTLRGQPVESWQEERTDDGRIMRLTVRYTPFRMGWVGTEPLMYDPVETCEFRASEPHAFEIEFLDGESGS